MRDGRRTSSLWIRLAWALGDPRKVSQAVISPSESRDLHTGWPRSVEMHREADKT
jgi:hypothetical protein